MNHLKIMACILIGIILVSLANYFDRYMSVDMGLNEYTKPSEYLDYSD